MTTPARKTQLPVLHFIAKTVNFSDVGVTTGLQIGTLPLGAVPITTTIDVNTAFNAGTTNTLSVGTTLTGTDYVSATAAGSAATSATAVPIAKRTALAADTPIYVSYGTAGTPATTGVATVHVTYLPAVF